MNPPKARYAEQKLLLPGTTLAFKHTRTQIVFLGNFTQDLGRKKTKTTTTKSWFCKPSASHNLKVL